MWFSLLSFRFLSHTSWRFTLCFVALPFHLGLLRWSLYTMWDSQLYPHISDYPVVPDPSMEKMAFPSTPLLQTHHLSATQSSFLLLCTEFYCPVWVLLYFFSSAALAILGPLKLQINFRINLLNSTYKEGIGDSDIGSWQSFRPFVCVWGGSSLTCWLSLSFFFFQTGSQTGLELIIYPRMDLNM